MADTFNNNQFNNQATNNENKDQAQNAQSTQSNESQSNNQPSQDTVDYSKVQLSDRTSSHDVDKKTRDLYIKDQDGKQWYAQLQAPSLKDLKDIQDNQYGMFPSNGQQIMKTTTVSYYERLFPLFHNLQVDSKPAGTFGWDFGNDHLEVFNWLIGQADSFLDSAFNTDK